MSAAEIAALITAVTALVTAFGTVLVQIQHLNWHTAAKKQPSPPVIPDPPVLPKP